MPLPYRTRTKIPIDLRHLMFEPLRRPTLLHLHMISHPILPLLLLNLHGLLLYLLFEQSRTERIKFFLLLSLLRLGISLPQLHAVGPSIPPGRVPDLLGLCVSFHLVHNFSDFVYYHTHAFHVVQLVCVEVVHAS